MRNPLALSILLTMCAAFTCGQSEINNPGASEKMVNHSTSGHLLNQDPALGPLQGGENIATAFVLPGPLPITSYGTTAGYLNDYNENCPYTFEDYAPDVVYQYTPVVTEMVDIDLCLSSFDTKVYVYENYYTPGSPFACNDDY